MKKLKKYFLTIAILPLIFSSCMTDKDKHTVSAGEYREITTNIFAVGTDSLIVIINMDKGQRFDIKRK